MSDLAVCHSCRQPHGNDDADDMEHVFDCVIPDCARCNMIEACWDRKDTGAVSPPEINWELAQ